MTQKETNHEASWRVQPGVSGRHPDTEMRAALSIDDDLRRLRGLGVPHVVARGANDVGSREEPRPDDDPVPADNARSKRRLPMPDLTDADLEAMEQRRVRASNELYNVNHLRGNASTRGG